MVKPQTIAPDTVKAEFVYSAKLLASHRKYATDEVKPKPSIRRKTVFLTLNGYFCVD